MGEVEGRREMEGLSESVMVSGRGGRGGGEEVLLSGEEVVSEMIADEDVERVGIGCEVFEVGEGRGEEGEVLVGGKEVVSERSTERNKDVVGVRCKEGALRVGEGRGEEEVVFKETVSDTSAEGDVEGGGIGGEEVVSGVAGMEGEGEGEEGEEEGEGEGAPEEVLAAVNERERERERGGGRGGHNTPHHTR